MRELLGGYAAGTLTAEEREALFQAALENQALFDALADEEALRELLADPASRAQLLRDLSEQSAGFWQRFAEWMRKPATLAFAGSAAALVLVVGVVRFTQRELEAPKLVAQAPAQVELPPPRASAVRQPEPKPMRPAAPAARTLGEQVRAAPEPMRSAAPPAETQAAPVREAPAAAAPVVTPEPMRPAAPPAQKPAVPARVVTPQPAALACVILARSSQGEWIETAPDATFREGAEVRLRVRSAEDGWILATARDGATVTMLTPPTGAPVSSGQDLVLPAASSFALAGASGEKNLRISFSPRSPAAPVAALQFAKSAAVPAARRKGDAAGSAQAPAVGASAEAAKRKAEAGESREEAAKPPLAIELRLVYRVK
ncbi:MAG: hypothetical protein Q8N47_27205 [Bryobacterales bacterium]|nr:hypothetical protein [Bryobacterales bacterium]